MFNHKLSPRLRGLGKFMAERVERRLAAILAADIVGYSKLMGIDEAGTLQRVKALRSELLHPKVADYNGRIVKTTGDGTLIEFPSAVNAVQHAVEVQREMAQRNVAQSEDQRIVLRRQPQAPNELSRLSQRQLADLRGDHIPSFVRWFRAA